eukprot:Tamp_04891.p1 GENE.Tamp_04891~~Tamp_04891.p1  ORF type:complete len:538 (+),score=84.00 Tamp_04891:688-2301(+)
MLYYADAVSYDHDTSLFYTVLKDWVLYLIFMASLYSFSYVGLRRYQRRRWTSATALRRDAPSPPLSPRAPLRRTWAEDDAALLEDDGVPFALCALSVAVALGSVLLVPMTVLDGLLRKHLSSEDLYGGLTAHTDLGLIWQNLFYVSTFCHLLVLPFAFLYTESEGLGRTAGTMAGRKVLSRLRETSVTLVLVLALVALLVQVLEMLQVPLMQQQRLTLSYIVTAMLGSLIFLVLVPFGFEGYICLAIRHAQHTFTAASDTQEELDTQELEWESFLWAAWRQQRQPKPKPKPRHSCTFPLSPPPHYSPPAPPDHSPRGLRASTTFEDKLGGGAWARRVAGMCGVGQAVVSHVASLVLVVASLVLPATVLVRVVVCQVLGDESRLPLSMVLDSAAVPEFARDALHACLDCILVTFVWKSTWRGLDSLPYLSAWYQRQSNKVLTVRELCVHCLVYLSVGTSWPVITCTLGLTRIQHVNTNSATALFQLPSIRCVCVVFLCDRYITVVQQGLGGAPGECLCIPFTFTLTLTVPCVCDLSND